MNNLFNSAVPTPIFYKYHFTIKQIYDETEPCSDYLLTTTSPLGFEYYFYADYDNPIDSIVYEALEFDEFDYYQCLKRRCEKKCNYDYSDKELLVDAFWLKKHLKKFCEDLLGWRAAA